MTPTSTTPHLSLMSQAEIMAVIDFGQKYKWVQIFKKQGAAMGCSNPHPHCQIWASSFLPNGAMVKARNIKEYMDKYKTNLIMDYAKQED